MNTNWILPITFLPGIGLLIMSTTALSTALGSEINDLLNIQSDKIKQIIQQKIQQLQRLNIALVGFYFAAAFFSFSALISGLSENSDYNYSAYTLILLCLGIAAILFSLFLLIVFSVKAVKIKKTQYLQRFKD